MILVTDIFANSLVSVINAQRVDRTKKKNDGKKRRTSINEVGENKENEKAKDLDRNECKGEADEEERKTSLLEDMLPFYLS